MIADIQKEHNLELKSKDKEVIDKEKEISALQEQVRKLTSDLQRRSNMMDDDAKRNNMLEEKVEDQVTRLKTSLAENESLLNEVKRLARVEDE